MSREIKFRVWDNELNKWATQLNLAGREPMVTLDGVQAWTANLHTFNSPAEPNRYIYEQYTGAHDKNGKDIYEGDFVRVFSSRSKKEYFRGAVEWSQLDFSWYICRDSSCFTMSGIRVDPKEVIGNIRENKGLPTQ